MRKPSQITQREIDLAAQRADIYGLLAIPQPPRRPRGLRYAALTAVVLALAGMLGLRFAPVRFVGNDCNPRVQECR